MLKIGDHVLIRGDNGAFNADIVGTIISLRRGLAEVFFTANGAEQVGTFNKSDIRKV